uniref:synaptotagmin-15-like n=1 Tax=Myxine glutinosa TaxID=7769 RepID=UPI00358E59A2
MTLCCCCHRGDSKYEEMQEPRRNRVSSEPQERSPVKQPVLVGDTDVSTFSLKTMLSHRRLSHMPWASVFFPNVLDPELCEMPPDDSSDAGATDAPGPRLRFALRYECASEQLKLWLLQGREIQVDMEPGLPLVHVALLPGKRGTVQCKTPKRTAEPVFEERFIFQVSPVELPKQTLQLSVYSMDPKGKHKLVGHVLFPLMGLQLEEGVKFDAWRSLKEKLPEASPERGSVCLSLGYNASLARITVLLLRAKDLALQGDAINTGQPCTPIISKLF